MAATEKTVTLKTFDGGSFVLPIAQARALVTIRNVLDDVEHDDNEKTVIPIVSEKVSSQTFEYIVKYLDHHKDDPVGQPTEEEGKKDAPALSDWDKEFANVEADTRYAIINAANFLEHKGIIDLLCRDLANQLKACVHKSEADVFRVCGLKGDDLRPMTQEEIDRIHAEHPWTRDPDDAAPGAGAPGAAAGAAGAAIEAAPAETAGSAPTTAPAVAAAAAAAAAATDAPAAATN